MIVNDASNVNLLGISVTVLMGILMILVPRKYALIPALIVICFITLGQRIVIADCDFTMSRILVLFGWLRLIVKSEISSLKFSAVDKILMLWIVVSVVNQNVLWQTTGAFINSMGMAYTAAGTYFLFRCLIRDFEDLIRIVKCLGVILVPLAVAALFERETGRNVFAFFGGVAEFTPLRDGRVRCTISFGDAILAGTFAATLMPLLVGLWFRKGSGRALAFLGLIASTIITILSNSSGPVLAYFIEIIGFMTWPFREKMRIVRWWILASVVALHMVMKAPVWALIGRLSEVFGGHGYDRTELIDAAISHFGEWWLMGTTYTAHWGLTVLVVVPNMVDMTNQYIAEGVAGGLLRMFLFIAIIAYSFRTIGRALQTTKDQPPFTRIFLWSMGVALLGHVASFMSVSYFSQIAVLWLLLLSMISGCDGIFRKEGNILQDNQRLEQGVSE